jgi:glutamate-1-semialdehyde 2,1-aminomutase
MKMRGIFLPTKPVISIYFHLNPGDSESFLKIIEFRKSWHFPCLKTFINGPSKYSEKRETVMKEFNTQKSKKLFEEIRTYLVDGVSSSFHKADNEEYPIAMIRGRGCRLYDVDGNEYIDYIGGFGPMILGYCPETVNEAIRAQLELGSQFSAPTEQLLLLAKAFTEMIPCAEMVSFQSSGTEANMHAWRIARAYTGKSKIVKFAGQYHGWSDEQKITVTASASALGEDARPARILGAPGQRQAAADDMIVATWNHADLLEKLFAEQGKNIAAVVMEPYMCDEGPIMPAPGYLEAVRDLCTRHNILLIFDEVITGMRMSLGGAQRYFGVTPDLSVFGKAIAGGYSLSMVCGSRKIMNCGVHASGTFNANPLAVAAALATIKELKKPGVYEKIDLIGEIFCRGIKKLGQKHGVKLHAEHHGAIIQLELGMDRAPVDYKDYLVHGDRTLYNKFFLLSRNYGVRVASARGRLYLTTAHTEEDIMETMEVFDTVFPLLHRERNDISNLAPSKFERGAHLNYPPDELAASSQQLIHPRQQEIATHR